MLPPLLKRASSQARQADSLGWTAVGEPLDGEAGSDGVFFPAVSEALDAVFWIGTGV